MKDRYERREFLRVAVLGSTSAFILNACGAKKKPENPESLPTLIATPIATPTVLPTEQKLKTESQESSNAHINLGDFEIGVTNWREEEIKNEKGEPQRTAILEAVVRNSSEYFLDHDLIGDIGRGFVFHLSGLDGKSVGQFRVQLKKPESYLDNQIAPSYVVPGFGVPVVITVPVTANNYAMFVEPRVAGLLDPMSAKRVDPKAVAKADPRKIVKKGEVVGNFPFVSPSVVVKNQNESWTFTGITISLVGFRRETLKYDVHKGTGEVIPYTREIQKMIIKMTNTASSVTYNFGDYDFFIYLKDGRILAGVYDSDFSEGSPTRLLSGASGNFEFLIAADKDRFPPFPGIVDKRSFKLADTKDGVVVVVNKEKPSSPIQAVWKAS